MGLKKVKKQHRHIFKTQVRRLISTNHVVALLNRNWSQLILDVSSIIISFLSNPGGNYEKNSTR